MRQPRSLCYAKVPLSRDWGMPKHWSMPKRRQSLDPLMRVLRSLLQLASQC